MFRIMGFDVLASEPSAVMRSILFETEVISDVRRYLFSQGSTDKFEKLAVVTKELRTRQDILSCDVNEFPYREDAVRFFSHLQDYCEIPLSGNWVYFEHKVFPMPEGAYSSPHAPYATVVSNFPQALTRNISITFRQHVTYPVIRKEVLDRYENIRFHPGTDFEKQYYNFFDTVNTTDTDKSKLHVVRNTEIGYKEGDGKVS